MPTYTLSGTCPCFVLQHINPRWNDQRLFEEARKIVVAQWQHITFNELLPLVLGQETMKQLELSPSSAGGFAADYDLQLNPNALNEFAVLAPTLALSWLAKGRADLGDLFHNPDLFYQRNGFEKLV